MSIEWKDVNKELPDYKDGDSKMCLVYAGREIKLADFILSKNTSVASNGIETGWNGTYTFNGFTTKGDDYIKRTSVVPKFSNIKANSIFSVTHWAYINKPRDKDVK